jgi:hypothetical protein
MSKSLPWGSGSVVTFALFCVPLLHFCAPFSLSAFLSACLLSAAVRVNLCVSLSSSFLFVCFALFISRMDSSASTDCDFSNDSSTISSSTIQLESQQSSAIDSPAAPQQLKRHQILGGNFEFVSDGEFDIEKFTFPALPPGFETFNNSAPDVIDLLSLDVNFIVQKLANLIGVKLQNAFHLIPPNNVYQLISDKFRRSFPNAEANFLLLKNDNSYNLKKEIDSFKNIGVSLFCLTLHINLTQFFSHCLKVIY